MLTATLNVNGMLWKSSPAVTELEQVTLSWLRQWMGLPQEFFGIIYDTASISSMHAIAAAREMADPEVRTRGNTGRLVMYTSEHSHSSIEKGAITLGIGQDNVRQIPVDESFRMRVDILRERMEADRRAGWTPFLVVATVGTTSTSSIDPVPAIADIAEEFGVWLHVDAAYGGAAAVVPELRGILTGAERAHSIVVNPHKWLFTPIDLSVFLHQPAGNPAPCVFAGTRIPEDRPGFASRQLHGLRRPTGPPVSGLEVVVRDAEPGA